MTQHPARPAWLTWTDRVVAAAALVVVAWACVTAWGAVWHGHPAYAVLLAVTAAGAGLVLGRGARRRSARRRGHPVLGVLGALAGIVWVAATAWLRPFPAVEPALGALASDADLTVTESATRLVLAPGGEVDGTALFFQPGAKVDARAYAAVLRPLAEAGHPVVVAKQPLGVAFLATGSFDDARAAYPAVDQWVLGGHSLGGVVATTQADAADPGSGTGAATDEPDAAPAVGLLLYASYPATDVSTSLTTAVASVSGSEDGLTTPDDVEASRADLPAGTTFTVVDGAVHSFFADYGTQPGDGTPALPRDEARAEISGATVTFVDGLAG